MVTYNFKGTATVKMVDEFNKILKEAGSLRKASEIAGMQKNAISEKFGRLGYKLDLNTKQYVLQNTTEVSSNNNTTVVKSNVNTTEVSSKNNTKVIEPNNRESEIDEIIEWYKANIKNNKAIEIVPMEIEDRSVNVTSIKMYKTTEDKLTILMEQNKHFKKQDLVNYAILEFCEKYLK